MSKLKLAKTRKLEIIEPDTLYSTYRDLIMDYYTELFSDYKNIKNEWFYQYYRSSYEKLMNMCNEFMDNEYELNIPFTNACKLYNHISKDFEDHLVVEGDLTKDLVDLRINFIHMELDRIRYSIFKKKETKEEKIQRELKLLDDLSNLLTNDEAEDLDRYINICRKRNGNKLK